LQWLVFMKLEHAELSVSMTTFLNKIHVPTWSIVVIPLSFIFIFKIKLPLILRILAHQVNRVQSSRIDPIPLRYVEGRPVCSHIMIRKKRVVA
jgi:hypothetical protein